MVLRNGDAIGAIRNFHGIDFIYAKLLEKIDFFRQPENCRKQLPLRRVSDVQTDKKFQAAQIKSLLPENLSIF